MTRSHHGADVGPTVPELICAQAGRTPDRVAVESSGESLTYAQLIAEATAIALHLRGVGVRPGDLVAVALPRGVDLVPALLGVQFARAAYLPLDPEHPVDRLTAIIADAGARVLVSADAAGVRGLVAPVHVHLTDVAPNTAALPPTAPDPDAAAYVIYTSGSTGAPKGVLVGHRAFANFIASMRESPGLPDDVVLPAVTTVSFDIAGLELFLPLTTGGRVVVARQSEASDPRRLAALLAATGARVMQATPITWRLLLEAGWSPPPGFTVLCGGERLPADLAERLLREDVVLWDLYGPTETTVWSSVTRYQRGTPTRSGPVRDTALHLLDEALTPVEPGSVGELYLGGAGLAAGYLRRPGLTATRFVADPFDPVPGSRLYRTGDLARQVDGRVEILGRTDDQIKIRGFRIEPGEIEHLLARHPAVAEAAVRAFGESDEATRLVGYLRPADPADPPQPRQLQLYLARSVPAYMIPAQFVVLAEFPRTSNGKLNRAALPAPVAPPPQQPAGRPAPDSPAGSTTEQRIAKIVAEVLQQPTVNVHEDFFALGGDSLRAVQIILRLNEELGTEVPINALFDTRTVYGLAALLDGEHAPQPQPVGGDRPARLSAAQWRLWLHQHANPGSTVDNAPVVVRLPGPLDAAALESALTGLLERHPILRTRYEPDSSGLPVPVVVPVAPVALAVEDGDPAAILAQEMGRPFDLAAGPPVRARLVCPGLGRYPTLLLVLHRIAADERSGELMAAQIRAGYRGRGVPDPPLGYTDFAHWQRELPASPAARRHLDYWRTALSGPAPAAPPTDRPRPAQRDWRAGTVRFDVPPPVVRAVQGVAADHDASRFMGLLAGYCALLAGWTGDSQVCVGIPAAGRDRPELEQVVGMVNGTAVVRLAVGADAGLAGLLPRVRETTLAALEHAVLPLEEIVAAAADTGQAEPGRNPLFDVHFAVHPAPADPPGFPLPDTPGTRYDLCCELTERADGGIDGRLVYATQLYDQETITRLAVGYVQLLEQAGASVPAVTR